MPIGHPHQPPLLIMGFVFPAAHAVCGSTELDEGNAPLSNCGPRSLRKHRIGHGVRPPVHSLWKRFVCRILQQCLVDDLEIGAVDIECFPVDHQFREFGKILRDLPVDTVA